MKNKFWLRLALLTMAAVMLVTVMAGCGKEAKKTDPDKDSASDVATTTTTTSDNPAVTDPSDGSTTAPSDGSTTAPSDGSTTTGTGTGSNAPSGSGSQNGTTTTTRRGPSISTRTNGKNTTTGNGSTQPTVPSETGPVYVDRDQIRKELSDVAMPQKKLANGTVTVFSWRDQQDENCYGGSKPDMRKVYKDAGITTKWYQATHANYMDALAAVVASGTSPDLVEWNATKMYPAAIASGLVVPIDSYINWNDKIWDDVRALTDKYRINGHTYFSVEYMQIAELLYYDPTIIKAAGLKTPLELWRENKWTLKALQEIADKTVKIDTAGNVTRYGFVPGNIGAITGLEMVEYSRSNGYKLNITNSKYKTLMNIMYQMGVNGTRSAGFTTPGDVGKGNVVMSMTAGWGMTNEMNAARVNGKLEWCILPRLDEKSDHYYNLTLQQTFGLIKGAKNPEGAAYLIELRKWAFLCYPWLETLPFTDTKYTRTYGEKSVGGDNGKLTAAEIKYSQDLLGEDYEVVANNLWGGWVGNSQFPGITEVISNGNSWSTVLANKKATMEAVLKQWKFN